MNEFPPPPPLPPPSLKTPSPQKSSSPNSTASEKDQVEEFQQALERTKIWMNFSKVFHVHYSCLESQLQDGPMCGLVALNMALSKLNVSCSINELYEMAVKKNFTKQGEMFSADWLAELTADFRDIKSRVIENGIHRHVPCILNCLLDNGLILVPYDNDHNFHPCSKLGHKAHWAVISGFVIFTNSDNKNQTFLQLGDDLCSCIDMNKMPSKSVNFRRDNCKLIVERLNFENEDGGNLSEGKLYFCARQGKSKHLGLWSFEELAASNNNLIEFSPERDLDSYILPTGGVEKGLKGKAILLCNNNLGHL